MARLRKTSLSVEMTPMARPCSAHPKLTCIPSVESRIAARLRLPSKRINFQVAMSMQEMKTFYKSLKLKSRNILRLLRVRTEVLQTLPTGQTVWYSRHRRGVCTKPTKEASITLSLLWSCPTSTTSQRFSRTQLSIRGRSRPEEKANAI